jgi:hypothetical protein
MTPRALLGQITRRALISAADRLVAPTKYPLVATTDVAADATDTCDGTCPLLYQVVNLVLYYVLLGIYIYKG